MFSRRDTGTTSQRPREAPVERRAQPEAVPVPAPPPTVASREEPARNSNESLIAQEDTFEGTLRTASGVRVLGTVQGRIEAQQYVRVEVGAQVEADITAQEVIIAGTYRGNLTCHDRVEIAASGRVRGKLDTNKLSLHEGGFFDGELHMQPPADEAPLADEAPPPPEGEHRQPGRARYYAGKTGEGSTPGSEHANAAGEHESGSG